MSYFSIKKTILNITLAFFLGFTITIQSSIIVNAHGPESIADLAEKLLPAVVNISTSQRVNLQNQRRLPIPQAPEGSPFQEFFDEFFNRRDNNESEEPDSRRLQSLGSGFVIDASGIVITNNHVIEGADEITVNFSNGSALVAEIIGRDPKTDIAVLKVEADQPLPFVKFGNSENMRVGDWVMAIGNPFGLGGTVTVGIVSAQNRDINSGPYDSFIQTDAAINRGNSGGPLFNQEGEVIGINTAIISPTGGSIGIGFAVPTRLAVNVIDQLREYGETRRGWLGVRIQLVTDDITESLNMEEARGALVAGVTNGGPAEVAKIEAGDVIIEFDGKEITTMRELPRIVAETDVGKEVAVVILRNGEKLELNVTLGRLEEGEKLIAAQQGQNKEENESKISLLGLTIEPLNDDTRQQYSIDSEIEEGVVITDVASNSNAEQKQIQPGDVIVEIAQEIVKMPVEFKEKVESIHKQGRRSVLLLLSDNNGELRFVALRIDEELE